MKQNGFTDAEIKENEQQLQHQQTQERQQLGDLVLNALRNRDQGGDGTTPPTNLPAAAAGAN